MCAPPSWPCRPSACWPSPRRCWNSRRSGSCAGGCSAGEFVFRALRRRRLRGMAGRALVFGFRGLMRLAGVVPAAPCFRRFLLRLLRPADGVEWRSFAFGATRGRSRPAPGPRRPLKRRGGLRGRIGGLRPPTPPRPPLTPLVLRAKRATRTAELNRFAALRTQMDLSQNWQRATPKAGVRAAQRVQPGISIRVGVRIIVPLWPAAEWSTTTEPSSSNVHNR